MLEDQPDIAHAVVDTLRRDGHDVVWASHPEELRHAMVDAPVELAILDVMMPGDDDAGFEIARRLRHDGYDGALLFMTARDSVDDRVEGLDLGADDYLVKPFSLTELRARVRALLRRRRATRTARVERGRLAVDLAARTVAWEGVRTDLTEREFAMLEVFAHDPDRTFASHELLDRIFPEATSGPAVVRVYVRQLRTKIDPAVIVTVAGGYRLGSG